MNIKLEAMEQARRQEQERLTTNCSPCTPDEHCAECPGQG